MSVSDWCWLAAWVVLVPFGLLVALAVGTHWYYRLRFLNSIIRIFEERPLFIVPKGKPDPAAEDVSFATEDGHTLRGCYLPGRGARRGVILFGLEYGSNRWGCLQYTDQLRDAGYDVFAFEPRNQGESDKDPGYQPLQWVTNKDLLDARAALSYLKRRKDAPADGVGLFGISKGGSVGMALAAEDPWVRCVATDGAYAAYTTMIPYMRRWVVIYSPYPKKIQGVAPNWFYGWLGIAAIHEVGRRRGVRFLNLEWALARLRAPLLMVHGGADTYIKPAMAETLFHKAGSAVKDLWLVPKAKHNQALHLAGADYHRRLVGFFDAHLAPKPVDADTAELAALPAVPLLAAVGVK